MMHKIYILLLLVIILLGVSPITLCHAKDGVFVWAKTLGSGKYDYGNSIFVDSLDNVYVTGSLEYDLFEDTDIFISKLDSKGDFVWTKELGGASRGSGASIFLDSSDNVYTTGTFSGTVDFDPGTETFNITSAGSADIFISKLDSNGNFVWARAFGANGWDIGMDVFVDLSDNVYVTGSFSGTVDFDPGTETFNITSAGSDDIVVIKLDSNGDFAWAKSLGANGSDLGTSIYLDPTNNIYVTGSFQDTVDFDPGTETFNIASAGSDDIFIIKLDSNGDFAWAKALSGTFPERGTSIFLDSSDNVYTTGSFQGIVDFDPGAETFNITSAGSADIFISKLDSNGNFVWARALGGNEGDLGWSIFVDLSDNVYTTGYFTGTADFDPGPRTFTMTSGLLHDVFISKLDSNGNFVWAKKMGASGYDAGSGIFVDPSGNIYTVGQFQKIVDFDPGLGKFNLTSSYARDVFISKLSGPVPFPWSLVMPGIVK